MIKIWGFPRRASGLYWSLLKCNITVMSLFYSLISSFVLLMRREVVLNCTQTLREINLKKDVGIICTGPSIDDIRWDVSGVPDCDWLAVNYGFRHPFYPILKPRFHVVIDSKIISGEWGALIDELMSVNPSVILILNSRWRNDSSIVNKIDRSRVLWITPTLSLSGVRLVDSFIERLVGGRSSLALSGGVLGAAVGAAMKLGCSKITIYGHDCDGLYRELVGLPTHSNGSLSPHHSDRAYSLELLMSTVSTMHWSRLDTAFRSVVINFFKKPVVLGGDSR